MKENLLVIVLKEKELFIGLIKICIWVNGNKTRCVVKENSHGVMGELMKVFTKIIKRMDLVYLNGHMAFSMMVIGETENKMDGEKCKKILEKFSLGNGLMDSLCKIYQED